MTLTSGDGIAPGRRRGSGGGIARRRQRRNVSGSSSCARSSSSSVRVARVIEKVRLSPRNTPYLR